jgi:hypothetical protein
MHELERVLEPELQDDAVRGVRVRCAIPRALVEPAESGELDSGPANVHLLGEHAGRVVWAELEVVDDGVVQVERGRAAGGAGYIRNRNLFLEGVLFDYSRWLRSA